MNDDYERRLSQAHRMFSNRETKGGLGFQQERRSQDRREQGSIDRRTLLDRRQQQVVVEHERRKQENRRQEERRSFEDRRVTSNWSEERMQEEREKLVNKQAQLQRQFWGIVVWLCLLTFLLWFLSGCTTKIGCGNETTTFLSMKFHNPIAQKCEDRPNRATDIVGF